MKKITKLWMIGLFISIILTQPVLAEGEDLKVNWVEGPTVVEMGDNLAQLHLPEHYIYANAEDTKKIMKEIDNEVSGQEIGMVLPESQEWFILFEFDPIGYVKDNESEDLDADKILESIKEATEEGNKKRQENGTPIIEVLGWDEQPHYDKVNNHLVWSILAKSEDESIVNYNTRVLGRNGVTSVTLVADPSQLSSIKPELNKIIGLYNYKEGNRYSDFNPDKDKVAEYGLVALVAGGAGVAASKLGILAKILLVFKKVWIILFAPFIAFYKKIKAKFSRRKIEKEDIHTEL